MVMAEMYAKRFYLGACQWQKCYAGHSIFATDTPQVFYSAHISELS